VKGVVFAYDADNWFQTIASLPCQVPPGRISPSLRRGMGG